MYIWGYQTPVFIPNWYDQVKKNSFLVKFLHFQGTNVHLGLPNSSFYPNRVKKNFIFSENFPFLGNKCTFRGTKLQFLSPICMIGSKTSFLVKFFHFQGTNVHLGVPNSSFYPHRVKKNFIFSEIFPFLGNNCSFGVPNSSFYPQFFEIFPFLGNKCTFGGTKLQFLSQSGEKNFIFSIFPFLDQVKNVRFTELIFIGSKKLHFQ